MKNYYRCQAYLQDTQYLERANWTRRMRNWAADIITKFKYIEKSPALGFLGGNVFTQHGNIPVGSGWDYAEYFIGSENHYYDKTAEQATKVKINTSPEFINDTHPGVDMKTNGGRLYYSTPRSRGGTSDRTDYCFLDCTDPFVLNGSMSGTSYDYEFRINQNESQNDDLSSGSTYNGSVLAVGMTENSNGSNSPSTFVGAVNVNMGGPGYWLYRGQGNRDRLNSGTNYILTRVQRQSATSIRSRVYNYEDNLWLSWQSRSASWVNMKMDSLQVWMQNYRRVTTGDPDPLRMSCDMLRIVNGGHHTMGNIT